MKKSILVAVVLSSFAFSAIAFDAHDGIFGRKRKKCCSAKEQKECKMDSTKTKACCQKESKACCKK